MSRASNPRQLSDEAVADLLVQELCPDCLGPLDFDNKCTDCGFNATHLWKCLTHLTKRSANVPST